MSLSSSSAHLLVDGYNIIGAWSSLQQTCKKYDLDAARHELIEALINYSSFQGFETQVVFDAHYQNTRGYRQAYTSNLSAYYTDFAETADTYIEKTCASHQRQPLGLSTRLIVATSDRAQQLTVVGYGAEWMSAQHLNKDVNLVSSKVKDKKRPKKQSGGRFLVNSLDPQAQQKLAQLRLGKQ